MLLNEFGTDLSDIAHLTNQQLRDAVLLAANWYDWPRTPEAESAQIDAWFLADQRRTIAAN